MLDLIRNFKNHRDIVDSETKTEKRTRLNIVRDRPLKSILKAVTWRMVGTADTIFISFLLTGRTIIAFSIGSIEVFTKMFLYFLHERLWEQLQWGRILVHIHQNRHIAKRGIFKTA